MSDASLSFTEGPLFRRLLAFALPLMAVNLLQYVYQAVDMVVVGQVVGPVGLVSISNATNAAYIVNAFVIGLTAGGRARRGRPAARVRGHVGGGPGGVGGHRRAGRGVGAPSLHGERRACGIARRRRRLHRGAVLRLRGAVPHERRSGLPQGAGRRAHAASAGGRIGAGERGARPGAGGTGGPRRGGRRLGDGGRAERGGRRRARRGAAAFPRRAPGRRVFA